MGRLVENERKLKIEQTRQVAEVAQVELSLERAERLAQLLDDFVSAFAKVRVIDASDYDPPILTFDSEADR